MVTRLEKRCKSDRGTERGARSVRSPSSMTLRSRFADCIWDGPQPEIGGLWRICGGEVEGAPIRPVPRMVARVLRCEDIVADSYLAVMRSKDNYRGRREPNKKVFAENGERQFAASLQKIINMRAVPMAGRIMRSFAISWLKGGGLEGLCAPSERAYSGSLWLRSGASAPRLTAARHGGTLSRRPVPWRGSSNIEGGEL